MRLLMVLVSLIALAAVLDAKPVSSADDEVTTTAAAATALDGKIDFAEEKTERIVIEPLPETPPSNEAKPRKSQRNYPVPVYYVTSKVNGRFGKSIQAFTADEFYEMYPIH